MKVMKKGTRALVLLLTLLLTVTLLPTSAVAASDTMAGVDNYVVNLTADPETSGMPDDFRTAIADGKVWTDKSVAANQDGSFDITLSALAQEYILTATGSSLTPPAADVVLVLDMSSSMTMGHDRVKPMINAANNAIDIIMAANPNNRVSVHSFGTNANVHEIMPIAAYTSSATGQPNTNDRYITVTGSNTIYVNGASDKSR